MARLSCHPFGANEVRPWLSVIAYNLGNLRWLRVLPTPIGKWSLPLGAVNMAGNQLAAKQSSSG